jgi:hypothetical protein
MKFLIQSNLMGEQWLHDVKAGVEHLPHEFVGVIPFSREITSNEVLEGTDYIPYGSTLFTNLAFEKGWKGLHFDHYRFNYTMGLTHRQDMLNGGAYTIQSAMGFLKTRPADEQWFIRPNADLKQFTGHCINAGECASWLKDAMECQSSGTYKLDPNDIVILSRPKDIKMEWRWFIVGRKVISGAMYRNPQKQLVRIPETCPATIAEAQEFANLWLPDPCCVMDLAYVDDQVRVIEFNCINSSGFYGHDIKKIFTALYEYHT